MQQSVFTSDQSFSIDKCGQVDAISGHAAILIPFYFFPLIILFVIITRKIVLKIKHILPDKFVDFVCMYRKFQTLGVTLFEPVVLSAAR